MGWCGRAHLSAGGLGACRGARRALAAMMTPRPLARPIRWHRSQTRPVDHDGSSRRRVVIVGAGAFGLVAAWHMAKRGDAARIVVLDEGEFASGATGRNGAGFRMQWASSSTSGSPGKHPFLRDRRRDARLSARDRAFKQDGYLVLAHSEKAFERLESAVHTQHRFGVPERNARSRRMLPPDGPAARSQPPRRRLVLPQGRQRLAVPLARRAIAGFPPSRR